MNADEIRKMDEATTDISGHFVPMLRSFFMACVKEGFDREQSYTLTVEYMKCLLSSRSSSDVGLETGP